MAKRPEKEGFDWEIKQIKMKIGWIEELRKTAPKVSEIDNFLKKSMLNIWAKLAKKELKYNKMFGEKYQT